MNKVRFTLRITGRKALFTNPATKISGEYMSYPMPTYSALVRMMKAVCPSGSIRWYIDEVRILNPILWEARGVFNPERQDIFSYNYLFDVDYIVRLHYVATEGWKCKDDYRRRRKIIRALGCYGEAYLGTSECPALIEILDEEDADRIKGFYDDAPNHDMGLMFHSYYRDGRRWMATFWNPIMINGRVRMKDRRECDVRQEVGLNEMYYSTSVFDAVDGEVENELAYKSKHTWT